MLNMPNSRKSTGFSYDTCRHATSQRSLIPTGLVQVISRPQLICCLIVVSRRFLERSCSLGPFPQEFARQSQRQYILPLQYREMAVTEKPQASI